MSPVIAVVATATSNVVIQSEDGSTRSAVEGMQLQAGELIITPEDGAATLLVDGNEVINVPGNQVLQVTPDILASQEPAPDERKVDEAAADELLQLLDGEGDLLAELGETAAGAGSDEGPDGEGGSIVRLIRISETTTPVDYEYAPLSFGDDGFVEPETDAVPPQPVVITLTVESTVTEGGSYTVVATLNNPVTGAPFVIQLNDGSVITIPVGESSGSVSVSVREDDVYLQGDEIININVTSTSGGNFSTVDSSTSVSVIVTDNDDVTVITIETPEVVVEGTSVVVTATVSNPVTGSPLVITLSNGSIITIPVGETSGSTEVGTREDDFYIQGDESLTFTISNVNGGNFEALDSSSSSSTVVVDDNDVTTITLTSPGEVVEGEPITVTATVSNPVTGTPLVIDLGNGITITIPVGESTGSVNIDTRDNDVYTQGNEQVDFAITNVTGGNYEALDTSSTTSTTVTDDNDVTAIILTSTEQVVEGGTITVTATVSQPVTGSPLVVNLDNGLTIIIAVGESSASIEVDTRVDDFYIQGTDEVTFAISDVSGGEYEALDTSSTTTSSVIDDNDVTTITLSGPNEVVEGQPITVTATVSNPVTETPLVIDLGNGTVITIPVGESSGSTTVAVRPEDANVQGNEQIDFAIVGTSGGNYEALDTSSTLSTTVVDSGIETNLVLTSTAEVIEGELITVTATVSNPVAGSPLVVDLGNGVSITIPVGATSGSTTVDTREDDVYVQGTDTITFEVVGTSGGSFDALNTNTSTSTNVIDDADVTTITLTTPAQVTEGTSITVTATVDNPVTGSPLIIDLGNGTSITIAVGASSGSTTVATRPADANTQGNEQIDFAIVGTSGGNYEALDTSSTASTVVTDSGEGTTLVLTSTSQVIEGQPITVTATVSNPVSGSPLVVDLGNGISITIPVGESSGSTTVDTREDDVYLQGTETITFEVVGTTGGSFDALNTDSTTSTNVLDDDDATVITLSTPAVVTEGTAITVTATVDNPVTGSPLVIDLGDGISITIAVGESSGSTTVETRPADANTQGNEQIDFAIVGTSGGNYEALDTSSTASTVVTDSGEGTTLVLTSTSQVIEGQPITVTATVSNPVSGTPLVVDLGNGISITIPVGESSGSTTVDTREDDVYLQGTETITFKVVGTTGGEYDALNTDSTTSTNVLDDDDATVITLSTPAVVTEGTAITVTATVDNPVTGSPLVIDLGDGISITIAVGESSGSTTVETRPADANVQGNEQIDFAIVGTSGGNYEALDTSSTASTVVTDTGEGTTLILSSDSEVIEGELITVTATVSNPVSGSPLVVDLGNGISITIPVGESSGSTTVDTRDDDVYLQGTETLTFEVVGTTGGSFDSLNTDSTTSTNVVDDDDATIITLSGPEGVTEGGQITIIATVENAPQDTPLVITLTNGEQITIGVGQTTGAVSFDSRDDDIYEQGDEWLTIGIAEAEGGNYEALDLTSEVSVGIMDNSDETVLTLGDVEYVEGTIGAITATLSAAPLDTLTVTLSNGATITFMPDYVPGTVVASTPFDIPVTEHGEPGSETDENIVLTITVDDFDGGQFENLVFVDGSLTIIDDIPVAANYEAGSLVEDGVETTLTGNVLTEGSFGADGAAATDALTFDGVVATLDDVAVDLADYGTLTLDATTGAWSFVLDNSKPAVQALNEGQTVTVVIGYTRTDADGDMASGTVSFGIAGENDGAEIIPNADAQAGEGTVYEAGLINGASDSETTTGSITVNATDGIASVTIGDETYSLAQLQGDVSELATVDTGEGVLTITGYEVTATGGVITYSYTLTAAQTHTQPDNDTTLTDSIAVSVAGVGGSSASGTVVITIVDDVPVAANYEAGSLIEDGVETTLTGNVLTEGSFGADGAAATDALTFDGVVATLDDVAVDLADYGTLTLDATTGAWSFVLDNSKPAVQALNEGQTVTVVIGYTRTDADGDMASGTVSFGIAGENDGAEIIPNADAQAGEGTVYEAGLINGASDSETTTGSITVNATDGIASVTIGDETYSLAQLQGDVSELATVDTGEGVLTITGYEVTATGGVITYSYTLTAAQTHTQPDNDTTLTDSIAVSVAGVGGSSASGTVVITIVDDVPVAANYEAGSLIEDGVETTLTGNVLTEGSFGADGAAATDALTFDGVVATLDDVAVDLADYGTLTLDATTGAWSFVLDNSKPAVQALNEGQTVTVVIGYTRTDADGDMASGTVSFGIAGENDGAEIIPNADAQAGEGTVYEAGLINGASDSETTTGSITVNATDGIASVTIGDETYSLAQLQGDVSELATVDTGEGVLTITGYEVTATGGVITYSYTLTAAQTHTQPDNDTTLTDSIAVSVAGVGGSSASGTVVITIVDDVPVAANYEAGSLIEDGVETTLTGNVLTEGSFGADGAAATDALTFDGVVATLDDVAVDLADYGTLTLDATTGAWSFVLDNSKPAVQALNEGQTVTVVIGYTRTDADGDMASGTVSFGIAGENDGAEIIPNADAQAGEGTVYEAGLINGASDSETTTGSITVNATDGIASVTIGDETYSLAQLQGDVSELATVDTGEGVLTITGYEVTATGGVITYSYTLTAAQTHTQPDNDTTLTDSIAVSVAGVGGSSASGTVVITIVDDVPVAANYEAGSLVEDGVETTLTGNVLTEGSFGADGAAATDALTFDGVVATLDDVAVDLADYGTLTLDATTGAWSFVLDNSKPAVQALNEGQTVTVVIGYTRTDADGDMASGTVSFGIAGENDGAEIIPNADAQAGEGTVYEAGLINGASDSETTTGSITVNATDGIASVTIGDETYSLAQLQGDVSELATVDTGEGVLTITGYEVTATGGVITYSYTLTAAQTHTQPDNDTTLTDSIAVSVAGVGGSSASGTVVITIVDDVPTISVGDALEVVSGGTAGAAEGSLSYNFGADGAGSLEVNGESFAIPTADEPTVVTGTNGTLTVNVDGSYSYQANPNTNGETDSFTFVITDADGDAVETTLNIDIVNQPPVGNPDEYLGEAGIVEGAGATSFSSVLTNDTDPDGDTLTVVRFSANADGSDAVTVDGVTTITTAFNGVVTMNADGTFTYDATNVQRDHADSDEDIDSFYYQVVDPLGGTSTWIQVKVEINDSTPTAEDDQANVVAGEATSGNVLNNDSGIDDPLSVTGVSHPTAGSFNFADHGQLDDEGNLYIEVVSDAGTLHLYADGSYTYTANPLETTVVVSSSSLATWTASVDLFGFEGAPVDGDGNLNLAALNASAQGAVSWNGGSKPGVGVSLVQSGKIDNDEYVVINLREPATAAVIGVNQFNAAQAQYAIWSAYDADGNLVGSGTFEGVNANGTTATLSITEADVDGPFSYISVGFNTDNQNSNAGFVISGLTYSVVPDNSEDIFTYYMQDQDGSPANAELVINITHTPELFIPDPDDEEVVLQPQLTTILEDGEATGNVLDGADDADRDVLTVTTFTVGSNTYNVGVTATIAGVGTLVVNADGSYTFTPAANWNGEVPVVDFAVTDGFTTVTSTLAVFVTPVNDAPTSADGSTTIAENNSTYTFELSDFAFADAIDAATGQDHALVNVIVTELPVDGSLLLNGVAVTVGQAISVADIAGGNFTYTAANNNSTSASFKFAVQDSGGTDNGGIDTSVEYNFNIDIGRITTVGNGNDTINGGGGDDVLLGDIGGSVLTVTPGTNYNIALIVDTSGSMAWNLAGNTTSNPATSRMALVKSALNKLANDLAGHDGIVNLSLIGFATNATVAFQASDLQNGATLDGLIAAINNLVATGGTNYEAAFNSAVNWFGTQPSAGFENLTYFLTDGDPTYYLNDNGTLGGNGSDTTAVVLQESVNAFQPLSNMSSVIAVGIGSAGVNQSYLQFFDNTDSTGQGYVGFGSLSWTTIANFNNNGTTGINSASGWSVSGAGTVNTVNNTGTSNDYLVLRDPRDSGTQQSSVFTSTAISIAPLGGVRFDYRASGGNSADSVSWKLLDANGNVVAEGTLSATQGSFTTITAATNLAPGDYRLQFSLQDNSTNGNLEIRVDNIGVANYPTLVTGPAGESIVIDSANELEAALESGGTNNDLAPVGADTINGGAGNDIIFGDVINTDGNVLDWASVGGRPANLAEGAGLNALKVFLKLQNGGIDPTDAQLYEYIRDNHEDFNVAGDTRGGNDIIKGGAGDDIIYGQGGNDIIYGGAGNDILYGGAGADTFVWELGDEGTTADPARDIVKDFNVDEGDKLVLGDLLPGIDEDNWGDYLEVLFEGGNTIIRIKTDPSSDVTQEIVLESVTDMTEQDIIDHILQYKGEI